MKDTELQKKILEEYIKGRHLDEILNSIDGITEDEIDYAKNNISIKIDDFSKKEKAIEGILWLLGEANLDLTLGEDEESSQQTINILQEVLVYIQN